jgi:hypothetical protein
MLLALLPHWRGFELQRAGDEPEPGALERFAKALTEALFGFLTIVKDMVTSEAGKYHPGQVLIAVGFLVFLVSAVIWLVAELAP